MNKGVETPKPDQEKLESPLGNFSLRIKFLFFYTLFGFVPFLIITLFLVIRYEAALRQLLRNNQVLNIQGLEENLFIIRVSSGMLFVLLVILIGTGVWVAIRFFIKPIQELTALIQRARQRKFADISAIAVRSTDEVGKLAHEINESLKYFIEIEEREKAISRAKSEFISIAAHQLRTPLTSIKWTLHLLLLQNGKNEETKNLTQLGFDSTQRMINLVNDLLSVTRIEEGRFGFTFQKADLWPLIEQTVAEFLPLAEGQKINLEAIPSITPLPKAYIDPERLSLVFSNLLANALNYTHANGSVTINAKKNKDKIQVCVADTGIGMTKTQQERLFTKFFRSEGAIRMRPDGSGLGLFIAKNVVIRHGGQIWVESEPGKGSTFCFTVATKETDIAQEVPFEQFFTSF